MKKKLIISIILVVVLCASIFTMAACKKGLSNEALDDVLSQLKYQLKNKDQITSVPGIMTWTDDKDNDFDCYVKWEVVGTNEVTVGQMDSEGLCAVTIPATRVQDINYTLKATLVDKNGKAYTAKDGSTYVAEFAQSLAKTGYGAMARQAFRDATVANPVVGTNYKLAFYLGNRYEVYYATGAMASGNKYMATDTDLAKAANATIETATDGFYIKLGDKYVTLTGSYSQKGNPQALVSLTATASTVFTVGENNILLGTTTCAASGNIPAADASFVLGTYGTQYTTIAASSDYYVTRENAGKVDTEQWVCRLCTDTAITMPTYNKPTEPAAIIAAVEELPANDYLPGGTYTLTGTVTEVTDTSKLTGTNPTISLKMTVGSKTIVCYQMKSAIDIPVGSEITVTGYLLYYKKDADTDAVVEFAQNASYIMQNVNIESSVDKVETPAADTAYKLTIDSVQNISQYYMLNAMGDGTQQYYVKTTKDVLSGVDFYVEAVTGGYKIYWLDGSEHKYVGAKYNATDKKTNLVLNVADAELVWTIDADGIHMTLNEKEVYIGTVDTYTNAGVYEAADNLWKAYLGTIKEDKTNATISVDKTYDNAEVELSKTTAKVGDEVTITVTTKNDYTIGAVKVNGETLTAESAGVYKFTVKTNSVISLTLVDPSGEAPEGSELNPYTVAKASEVAPAQGTYSEEVYVQGYIVGGSQAATPTVGTGGQVIFYIADTVDGTGIQIRYANLSAGINAVGLGDKVVVKGLLTKYGSDAQVAKNKDVSGSDPVVVSVISRANASIEYVAADNVGVTITITGAEGAKLEGKNGDAVTFTVAVLDGYQADSLVVKVNGSTVTANNGTYTVYLSGTMTITTEVLGNDEDPKGTATNPYTVAEAIAAASALSSNGYNDAEVYVTGIVVTSPVDLSNPDYGKQFSIAATMEGTSFLIYGFKYSGDITAIYVGDTVTLRGYLKNLNGNTPEMASRNPGSGYVYPCAVAATRGDASIKVNDNSSENASVTFSPAAAENGFVTGKNGDTVTFTVEIDSGYELDSVVVAGSPVEADNGTYTVVLVGSMEVTIKVNVVGATKPETLYTVATKPDNSTNKSSQYTSTSTATITDGGLTLTTTGCNTSGTTTGTQWDHIRLGGKNGANGDATIKTATAIAGAVSSIKINISAGANYISAMYLEVSNDANFTTTTKVNLTSAVVNADNEFAIASPAEGKYYRITFSINNTTSSNGVVHVNSVTFIGFPAATN